MTEVVILPSAASAGELGAEFVARLVGGKPDAVLGLATGSTPLPLWTALAARDLDLTRVRGFALDEYIGLPPGHPESYRSVITREVVEPLRLTPSLVHVPGDAVLSSGERVWSVEASASPIGTSRAIFFISATE